MEDAIMSYIQRAQTYHTQEKWCND